MTNRRKFLVEITMAASAATFLKPFNAFADFAGRPFPLPTTTLTILHSANLGGQRQALDASHKLYGMGGLKNLVEKVRRMKSVAASALVIHSGDICSLHTPQKEVFVLYQEMAKAGYDLVIPGQSDLKKGRNSFSQLAKKSGLPILPADPAKVAGTSLLPHQLLTKGAIQAALVHVPVCNNIFSCAESLNVTASFLRESKKCHLIIGIVQSSGVNCVELATLTYGIDVLISDAENSFLYNTKIIQNKNCEEAIVSFAGSKGTMMSHIELTFNAEGTKIAFASQPVFIGAEKESFSTILKRYSPLYA